MYVILALYRDLIYIPLRMACLLKNRATETIVDGDNLSKFLISSISRVLLEIVLGHTDFVCRPFVFVLLFVYL